MDPHSPDPPQAPAALPAGRWKRWLGPAVILLLMALAYIFDLHGYLSLSQLAEHRASLRSFTAEHLGAALLVFAAIYAIAVALSIPGASLLTMAGGLLFGWLLGGLAAVIAATLGAVAIFLVARSAFGDVLSRRAGPALTRLKDGFTADAFNYLLFLRLVPLFPFWLVNIAPAFANVGLRTFVAATALGIIPGTFAFAFVGQGLDSVLDVQAEWQACMKGAGAASCPDAPALSDLITAELLLAFAALGLVALIPVGLKKWNART